MHVGFKKRPIKLPQPRFSEFDFLFLTLTHNASCDSVRFLKIVAQCPVVSGLDKLLLKSSSSWNVINHIFNITVSHPFSVTSFGMYLTFEVAS
jgi:hypothetical protein